MVAVRAGPRRRAFHRAGRPSKAPVGSKATSMVIAAAISVVPSSYPSWSTSRSVQPDEPHFPGRATSSGNGTVLAAAAQA